MEVNTSWPLLGHLNVGVEDVVIENVVGRYGVTGGNDSGKNLMVLFTEREIVVGNSLFFSRSEVSTSTHGESRSVVQ